MLVVRLKRIGKKNQPTYRIVVAEHSNAVNGPFVEDIGFYNPHTKTISVDQEAVIGWMNKGAKPSNRVARLLEKEKVQHKSVVVIQYHKASKKKVEETKPAPKAETATDLPAVALAEEGETAEAPTEGETTETTEEAPAETSEEVATTEEEAPAEEATEDVVETPEATEEPAENSEPVESAA
ncbi:MAG: 30S ribosomal protein S16 [Patescibacteria group bacterium]